jgi:TATA-box binding protein (TBP) (component of TFIID and TFIIIB)
MKMKLKDTMELKDTIEMMQSADYKERFRAEYYQTKIRYEKLHEMCLKYETGKLNFTPSCSLELLKEQKSMMGGYLNSMEKRALIEEIDL